MCFALYIYYCVYTMYLVSGSTLYSDSKTNLSSCHIILNIYFFQAILYTRIQGQAPGAVGPAVSDNAEGDQ